LAVPRLSHPIVARDVQILHCEVRELGEYGCSKLADAAILEALLPSPESLDIEGRAKPEQHGGPVIAP